jgi:flagellar basal-body rod protein FlgB
VRVWPLKHLLEPKARFKQALPSILHTQEKGQGVQQVQLFNLISQNNTWLAARQATVAQNVANASTPGFRALDVRPFSETLDQTALELQTTGTGHLSIGQNAISQAEPEAEQPADSLHSGNTVALEREFAKSGEISRGYALNTGILKSFHRMLLLSTKA